MRLAPRIMRTLLVALLVVAAAPLPAQTCIYNGWNTPTLGTTGFASTFGSQDTRFQIRVPATVFQNVPCLIRELAFANTNGWTQFHFDQITVKMGYTNLAPLSTSFATNITSPQQTVLFAQQHDWLMGIGSAWVPVGLQTPFQFLPGHGDLLIDIVTINADSVSVGQPGTPSVNQIGHTVRSTGGGIGSTGQLTSTSPLLRLCVDSAETSLLGSTCQGSSGSTPLLGITGIPTPGAQTTFWLSDAPSNGLAIVSLGLSNAAPFPIDLTSFGAPGCRVYFPYVVLDAVSTNAIGIAPYSLTIPTTPTVVGSIFLGQFFVLDPPANAAGITASNYGRLLVGQ